ncbi:hypothetical protein WA158_000001 [Blastocystis sp. Blastoise]
MENKLRSSVYQSVKDFLLSNVFGCLKNESYILIVDNKTKELINSTIGAFTLYENGCILIEHIESIRDEVHGVKALYFITPTSENLEMLYKDFGVLSQKFQEGGCWDKFLYCGMKDLSVDTYLYDDLYIRFLGKVEEETLQNLKQHKVIGKHLKDVDTLDIDVKLLEENLFSLDIQKSCVQLFGRQFNNELCLQIAKRLVEICVVMDEDPVIRNKKGFPCEDIAKHFEQLMKDYKQSHTDHNFVNHGVLLLVDRSVDPLSPLLHDYTYQSLLMDVLPINDQGEYKDGEKTYIFNREDTIYEHYKYMHILNTQSNIKTAYDKLIEYLDTQKNDISTLADLVKKLPEIRDQKDKLAIHFNMTKKCMTEFATKNLKAITEMEQNLCTACDDMGTVINREDDKIRLILLYCILYNVPDKEIRELISLGKIQLLSFDDISNIKYMKIKTSEDFSLLVSQKEMATIAKKDRNNEVIKTRYISQIVDILDLYLSGDLSRQEYEQRGNYPSVSIHTKISSVRGAARNKRLFDGDTPSIHKEMAWYGLPEEKPHIMPGERVIVFVAGGICYNELKQINSEGLKYNKNIIIGTTEMLRAPDYIQQIKQLSE